MLTSQNRWCIQTVSSHIILETQPCSMMDNITHCSALQPTSLWVCQENATYATCMLQGLFHVDLEFTWHAYCKVSSYSLGGQSGNWTRMDLWLSRNSGVLQKSLCWASERRQRRLCLQCAENSHLQRFPLGRNG